MSGIFKSVKQSVSAASNASVTMFGALDTTMQSLDNVAAVGLVTSADWRKQAEFESSLKDKARQRLMSNEKAINHIETQMLTEMIGDYVTDPKATELFALPK